MKIFKMEHSYKQKNGKKKITIKSFTRELIEKHLEERNNGWYAVPYNVDKYTKEVQRSIRVESKYKSVQD